MAKKSSSSILLPVAVLLIGAAAFRIQRPRLMASVAKEHIAQDSVRDRISKLRGLSHQDTTALRKQAHQSEDEILAAEAMITPSVDIPALMINVDALARRFRLKSGPLAPDSTIVTTNQVSMVAAPYGAETFQVGVTGTWGDVVGFVDALPTRAGRIMVVPTIRRLTPSTSGDGPLTADIAISIITQHSTFVAANPLPPGVRPGLVPGAPSSSLPMPGTTQPSGE
jgi:hypothetical protein